MTETLQLIFLAAICGFLWSMTSRLRALEELSGRLDRLDEIKNQLARLANTGGELDLRRLEHVLIDIRDGHKRLEDRLLQLAEAARDEARLETPAPSSTREPERKSGSGLGERVVNRLLAMGYERIQLVTPVEEIQAFLDEGGEGEVLVEARRGGAVCKGRIVIRAGSIAGVEFKTAHSMFP